MPRLTCCAVLALVGVATTMPWANAITTFSNFGPGFARSTDIGLLVGRDGDLFGNTASGVSFIAEATGRFDMLWIAANAAAGTPNDGLTFTLTADEGGMPGAAIESLVLNDICDVNACPTGQLFSASASQTNLLTEGVPYWLVGTAGDPVSSFLWFATTPEQGPGTGWIKNLLSPPEGIVVELAQPGAFRIDVTPRVVTVPEPATATLVAVTGIALLAFLLHSTHRRSMHAPKGHVLFWLSRCGTGCGRHGRVEGSAGSSW